MQSNLNIFLTEAIQAFILPKIQLAIALLNYNIIQFHIMIIITINPFCQRKQLLVDLVQCLPGYWLWHYDKERAYIARECTLVQDAVLDC